MNSAFSPDDRLLATASIDGPIRIWDVGRASLFATITGHRALIEHLEFSPVDSNILLTASHDGTARLWDVDGILTTALLHEYPPTFAVFSPDNVHLLTGGGDAKAHLWDVAGREIAEFDTGEIVHSATFSPDGSRIATASLAGRVLIWDVASKTPDRARSNLPSGCVEIQFSPKGDLLAAGSGRGTARLWDAATGAEVATIPTSETLPQVVFNPRRRSPPRCDQRQRGHLVKPDGTELKKLVGHERRITGAAFSPDGQLVATASLDHTARIWSVKDGSTVAILKGHSDELTTVSFSPDGQSAADCLTRRHRANLERPRRNGKGSSQGTQRRREQCAIQCQWPLCRDRFIPGSHGPSLGSSIGAPDGGACQSGRGEQAAGTDARGLQFGWNQGRDRVLQARPSRHSRFSDTRRPHRFREANCSTRTDRLRTASLLPSRRRRR